VVYDPRMRAGAVERLRLENDLMSALPGEQLRLVYQPVVDLETEEIVGFEALLRWHHPTLGTITPDRFIPIAEDTGLIVPIGQWVLDTACRTAARWQREYSRAAPLTMAVNVSAAQLGTSRLVTHVADALAASGIRPSTLVLEVTETAVVEDVMPSATRLHALHELGVRLAIDDFGTGYSSLSYLRQFPVDLLKIDRSFVSTITEPDRIPPIVRGLLDLGRTLELETIAEGIELELQRSRLREESCRLGQGFLFARPLAPEDAETLLAERTGTPDICVTSSCAERNWR
jgi:EAL domain-containing protein (putative c-di-GMP-specific phosphodiesterase class I)